MINPKRLNVNINGNKKLINNNKVRFIIWNLPAIKTCPFATDLCKKYCYARKAEKVYPGCLASRERNLQESKNADFVTNMIFTINKELNKRSNKDRKIVFRLHESGDFYNKEYAFKWLEIARHFINIKNLVFVAYTKSLVYFVGADVPKNFIIRASVWDDTKQEQKEIINLLNLPIYTAIPKFDDTTTNNKRTASATGKTYACKCANCAKCGACWNNNIKNIACKIH